ncbi:MAG: hypothetical protein PHQ05_08915 [Sterolibacterium sp.]|nr:hypothetical protein [Sterolibacterium sp.]
MVHSIRLWLLALIAFAACESMAESFSGGVTPGARTIAGNISEWAVPTPKYPRDPAIVSGGNVYFAVKEGDKIARFDSKGKHFHEWDVPAGMRPRCPVVARDGKVFFGGAGNNAIGELNTATGKVTLYKIPSDDSNPYTLIADAEGNIWFTEKKAGKLGKLERASGMITEYPVGDDPYSLLFDRLGNVWITRKTADRLVKFDPKTGKVTELSFGKGAQPRRVAMTPDGMLWVALYGAGRLAKIDPAANRVVKEYELPGGPNAGPYAVNADAAGRVWVSEIQTNNVVLFDPRSEAMRVFKLPTRDTGVRNAAIDAEGRYWYVGSHAGRMGVIE